MPSTRHRVVALVGEGFHPFEFGVACELFGVDRVSLTPKWYRFAVASSRPVVKSSLGFSLSGIGSLQLLRRADTIVITGWEALERPPSDETMSVLCAAARRGARLVSFCSGAFALAHAGLVRKATTHWLFAERFARAFPHVELDTKPLWLRDGHVWTAAGTAAAVDCGLALVADDFGQDVANQVARRMVAAPCRDGGQVQFIEHVAPVATDRLEPARQFAMARLDEPLSVRCLAKAAGLSPRTFARRFEATMGTTPHAWVSRQRVERARVLLEGKGHSIDDVAAAVGMSATNFRAQFRRQVGTAPSAYRARFSVER